MLNEAQAIQAVEQAVRNVMDLGILPTVTFAAVLHNLRILENPLAFRVRRALLVGVLTGLSLFGAACRDGYTLQKTNPDLHAQLVLSDAAIAQAAEEVRQKLAEENEASNSQESEKSNHLIVTVKNEGDGLWAALERGAKEQNRVFTPLGDSVPEGMVELVQIRHFGNPDDPTDDWIKLFKWKNALAENPVIDMGDELNYMVVAEEDLANMQLYGGFLAENIHVN